LVRSFKDIKGNSIWPITYKESRSLIDEPNGEVSLADMWPVTFVLLCVLIIPFDVFEIVIFNICG